MKKSLIIALTFLLVSCGANIKSNFSEQLKPLTIEDKVAFLDLQNQVPEDIKHKRFDRLKELVESQIAKNNSKYVGTIQKVLVEGPSKNNPELLTGRTDSNKVVIFEGSKELIDTIIDLKIISEHMWYLKGEIV